MIIFTIGVVSVVQVIEARLTSNYSSPITLEQSLFPIALKFLGFFSC